MPTRISLTSNAAAIARQLGEVAPTALVGAIVRGMKSANADTVSTIQEKKLTKAGPKYLNVRTGRLRRSARATAPRADGRRVVSEIGSNVNYAARHEFGFQGTERVRSFVRRLKARNRTGKIEGKRRRVASGVSFVKSFTRKAHTPARRMFQDGIAENQGNYKGKLTAAILAAWAGLQA